jgi:hypothetical protein
VDVVGSDQGGGCKFARLDYGLKTLLATKNTKSHKDVFHVVEDSDFQPQMLQMDADGSAGGHILVRRQEI